VYGYVCMDTCVSCVCMLCNVCVYILSSLIENPQPVTSHHYKQCCHSHHHSPNRQSTSKHSSTHILRAHHELSASSKVLACLSRSHAFPTTPRIPHMPPRRLHQVLSSCHRRTTQALRAAFSVPFQSPHRTRSCVLPSNLSNARCTLLCKSRLLFYCFAWPGI
jgi:hypothetical protein